MEPDILVLDEPTSGLDPKGRDDLLKLFTSIHQTYDKTVVIITHDMNTVYDYANRVLVMNKGSLVFDGTPQDLFQSGDLEQWNLDLPDLLVLAKALEEKYQLTFDTLPTSIPNLLSKLKGGVLK
jgi:energy-coupling factor transport system ATP-binding protein